MTEYSKGSRNRGPPTQSHTGERSKQGPTHPYSNGTQSPSVYSASRSNQDQSPQDMSYNFQISHQYIMPLIQTIKDQNMHLKHERSQIEIQMSHLHKISELLLNENQKLRRHHSSRTQDIKKLVETISINASEEINDINHQSFLIKESNCALVKQIQLLMKAHQSRSGENQNKQKLLDQMSRKNVQVEQASRDIQVKNKQLFFKCQQAKIQSSKLEDDRNELIVNQLLREVTSLKNINKNNIIQAKTALNQHQEQRPAIVDNLNSIVAKLADLGSEAKEMQQKMKNSEEQLEKKKDIYEKSVNAVVESCRQYEKRKNDDKDIEAQKMVKRILISEQSKRIQSKQQKLNELIRQKKDLTEKINQKRHNMKKHSEYHRQKRQQQNTEQNKKVKQAKEEMRKQQQLNKKQLSENIRPQLSQISTDIQNSKEQYASLVQEVDDFRQGVSKLDNPLKQIIRIQYQIKKKSIKK